MQQWEYETAKMCSKNDLLLMGSQGWELCAVYLFTFYFKRPKH